MIEALQTEILRQLLEDKFRDEGMHYDSIENVLLYYDLILKESARQNITRILQPRDFYYRHVYDCMELLKTNWIDYPCLDLGSGVGVPGLLTTLLSKNPAHSWILAESEKKKLNF